MSKPGFGTLALVLVWSAGGGGALACSREAPAPRTTAAAAAPLDSPIPAGRLPEGATPLAYRLELELVPSASTFSGHTHIEVELARAFDRICDRRPPNCSQGPFAPKAGEPHILIGRPPV